MSKSISRVKEASEKSGRTTVEPLRKESMDDRLISYARQVCEVEAEAMMAMSQRIDSAFSEVVKKILTCTGRVIVCGMGKSGIIGRKISCTLASTGTPSFFMHPAEAFHGDLGMIKGEDILLLIAYSGETEEVLRIIPFLKENGNLIISMTGNANSTLANNSDYHLDVNVKREACPLQVTPTTSATVALVMGDALTIALMKERGFKTEDYARFHPGGDLGRRLLTKVGDVMIRDNFPIVREASPMKDVIQIMTSSRLGTAVVVDEKQRMIGIITDGDLRRALNQYENIFTFKAEDIMTRNPKVVSKDLKLYEAERLFNTYEIVTLLVCSKEGKLLGLLQFHDA